MAVYSDYAKDRIGWFFGLTGWQLGTLAVTSLPAFWALNTQHWALVGTLAAIWALLALLPVLGPTLVFAVMALRRWPNGRRPPEPAATAS